MSALRLAVLAVGGLLFVLGLGGILDGAPEAGASSLLAGSIVILAVVLERQRYRSEQAERSAEPPGPGGGEIPDEPLGSRFRRTEEVFVDPSSRRKMRVYVDPATGERRYRSEG